MRQLLVDIRQAGIAPENHGWYRPASACRRSAEVGQVLKHLQNRNTTRGS
jgi:hypothetical protein